jgi:aryl-alcohol dehydrogenase-like predicted oxidoreductase
MQQRQIGNTGIACSAIGLGSWAIGGAMWGSSDDTASRAAIAASLDGGISLVDTAPGYGLGHAETLIGEAIRGRRDQVVIATKCGLNWHHGKGTYFFEQYGQPVHRYLGADGIVHELEQSLGRLRTDHVDIYITHWQDSTTPIDETLEALHRLRSAGKIRAIGASNLAPQDLDAYIAGGGVDCIQERYSLIDRDMETTLLPLTAGKGISTLAYSPLGMGLLTGSITADRTFSGDDIRQENPRFSPENRQAVARFSAAVADITSAHDISLGQMVIAWTLQRPQIDFVLCGARNPGHAAENARAGSVALSVDEIALINRQAAEHLSALSL